MSFFPNTQFGGFGSGTAAQVLQELSRSRAASQQHALLGDATFNLITYFEGMDATRGADFAEHARILGKPALQFIGDKLEERTFAIVLHAGFCNPAIELLKLREILAGHEAHALMFSGGDLLGYFVMTDLTEGYKWLADDGAPMWVECSITLKEFVRERPLNEKVAKRAPTAAHSKKSNTPSTGSRAKPRKPANAKKNRPPVRPADAPLCRNNKEAYWKS